MPDPIIPGANEYQRKLARRGRDKQKAQWGEKMGEMEQLGIEYHLDWSAKAK